jgi:hypothetical protein
MLIHFTGNTVGHHPFKPVECLSNLSFIASLLGMHFAVIPEQNRF